MKKNNEKCRRAERSIRVLTKENFDAVTETRDLLLDTRAFYTSLCTAQPYDGQVQADFLSGPYPRLWEDARVSCEGMIIP